MLGFLLSQRQQFPIGHQVRDTKLRNSGLPRPSHLAGTAELEIDFSETESIASRHHCLNALPRDIAETVGRHQNTKRLMRAASDTAPQLMELRNTETLCMFDQHDGGVRDIHADFDNRR